MSHSVKNQQSWIDPLTGTVFNDLTGREHAIIHALNVMTDEHGRRGETVRMLAAEIVRLDDRVPVDEGHGNYQEVDNVAAWPSPDSVVVSRAALAEMDQTTACTCRAYHAASGMHARSCPLYVHPTANGQSTIDDGHAIAVTDPFPRLPIPSTTETPSGSDADVLRAVTGVTTTMRYALGELVDRLSGSGRRTARELGYSRRTLVALEERGLVDERLHGWDATSLGERWLYAYNEAANTTVPATPERSETRG